jgi:hypothetical protein
VKSTDGGATWGSPVDVDLYVGMGASRFPTVTVDDAGNPIVTYMKFDMGFGNARWVVVKSTDGGATFGVDTIASGWSSPTSTVCDCCPGSIVASPDYVAVSYRDNNSNVRDTWVGVSTDNGDSFTGGMDLDQNGWVLASCPSTGPDAIIVGDTIISVFTNGEIGLNRVYYNKASLATMTAPASTLLTGSIAGLSLQNYPRISNYGDFAAVVWKQTVSGTTELPFIFTNDLAAGFSTSYEIVATESVVSADVVIFDGEVHVVWQNNTTGTVRYRKGTFTGSGVDSEELSGLKVFPNPSSNGWNISAEFNGDLSVMLTNMAGEILLETNFDASAGNTLFIDNSKFSAGMYNLRLSGDGFEKSVSVQK